MTGRPPVAHEPRFCLPTGKVRAPKPVPEPLICQHYQLEIPQVLRKVAEGNEKSWCRGHDYEQPGRLSANEPRKPRRHSYRGLLCLGRDLLSGFINRLSRVPSATLCPAMHRCWRPGDVEAFRIFAKIENETLAALARGSALCFYLVPRALC